MSSRVYLYGGAVIVLIVVLAAAWRYVGREERGQLPKQARILCGRCDGEWVLPYRQATADLKRNKGRGYTCPRCRQPTGHQAKRCPHCDRLYYQTRAGAGRDSCPRCKAPLRPQAPEPSEK